jgi:hypothetical protein
VDQDDQRGEEGGQRVSAAPSRNDRRLARFGLSARRSLADAVTRTPSEEWEWWGDAETPDLFIAGHSHRRAFRTAILQGLIGPSAGVALLERPREAEQSHLWIAPDRQYWKQACAAAGSALVLVWKGNQHNHRFLLDTGTDPLPEGDVSAPSISALWAGTLRDIEVVVPRSKAERVILLGTPPPKSEEETRRLLSKAPRFAEEMAAAGTTAEDVPMTPGPTRVALWRILQDDVERAAGRAGADFVGVPATVQTPEGYLKPEFSAEDISHANAEYAVVMLEEIRSHLARATQ